MRQILDLHIHSRFSRACSSKLTLPNLEAACRIKGIDILATGDFTHPAWFKEISEQLEEVGNTGLYKLKTAVDERVKFILETEVALIFRSGDKVRRIHLLIYAPNLKAAKELNDYLGKKYNIRSDGRPILGMSAVELFRICLSIHPQFMIIPAHIWTPWFSVFGSKSGFNHLEECFGEYTEQVFALETGLSSDPEMNFRVSELDRLTILSNSDAHSLTNLGREANIFELESTSYNEIYQAIKTKDLSKIKSTLEFYPEEGMYHFDGHRECGIVLAPSESKKQHDVCPVCKRPLTIGVLHRVEELADRPEGYKPASAASFKKLVELDKIIAQALGVKSRNSVRVQTEYDKLITELGSEIGILLDQPLEQIAAVSSERIAEGIRRVRAGELMITPGFDGQYGEVKIF